MAHTAKQLPCDSPTCGEGATLRDGSQYTIGRVPHSAFPFRAYCARCQRTTLISAQRWNQLPTVEVP